MSFRVLRLRNWQNHLDLKLKLDRITVIIGDNGKGKSAVVRALKWVCLNVWEGVANDHVTQGEEESEVSLEFDEHTVVRTKGDRVNTYRLDGGGELKAFGNDVPSPIVELLHISPASFQSQGEPAFWLSLTGGQAAAALNEIFCLDAIDSSLSAAASEVRTCKTRHAVTQERLDAARKARKDLDWVKQADADLKELEELHAAIASIDVRSSQIQGYLRLVENLAERASSAEARSSSVEAIVRQAEAIQRVTYRERRVQEYIALQEKEACLTRDLTAKTAKLATLMKGRCPLCGRASPTQFPKEQG